MLRLSALSIATPLCVATSLPAQDVDSVEVTPHDVVRPVTQNTGTNVGACQQFMPWAYDAHGGRVRRELTYVWSVSNSADFEVDTVTGGVCARQTQLSDTVATVVTATITGEGISGASSFTVTPDPAAIAVAVTQPAGPGRRSEAATNNPTGTGGVAEAAPDPDTAGTFSEAGARPPGPPPTGVTAAATSPTTVRVAWTPVAGANRYDIVRASKPGGPFRVVSSRAGRITSQTSRIDDPGVFPDSTVHYQVLANYADGRAGTSATVSATTPRGAAATNFTAIAAPGSIILTWTAAPGASGYKIQRGDGTFAGGKDVISDTTFTDTGLPPRLQTYQLYTYYRVAGVGDVEGDLTRLPKTHATPKTVGPADFRYAYRGGGHVEFFWAPVSGATGYKLLRANASDGHFQEPERRQDYRGSYVGTLKYYGDSSAVDHYLDSRNAILYKVLALYPGLPAGESAIIRFDLGIQFSNPPPGVTLLVGSAPGPGKVVLKWKPAAGAQWYDIYRTRGYNENLRAEQIFIALNLPGTTASYTDTDVRDGMAYVYTVFTLYGPNLPGKQVETVVALRP